MPEELRTARYPVRAALVALAHARMDRADALLAREGASQGVLRAYVEAARSFRRLRLHTWAAVMSQRIVRCIEVG